MSYLFQKKIDSKLVVPFINKIIDLPYDFYKLNGSGAFVSKINDLSYIKEMYYKIVEVIVTNLIIIVIFDKL